MPIPRRCEYVFIETKNRCERLAVKKYNGKWICNCCIEELENKIKK